MMPTTFSSGFNKASALKTPRTTAEPHISYFISSILPAGLIDIPPESNVNPFPTNTLGFLPPPFIYSRIINFGGSSVPCATPARPPIPISVNSSLSNTVRSIPPSSAISFADAANLLGVVTLPG